MRFGYKVERLIGELRNIPTGYQSRNTREPVGFESTLTRLIRDYKLNQDTPMKQIMREWAPIMGPEYCNVSEPITLTKEGDLIIAVRHPMVKSELEFQKRDLMNTLTRVVGRGVIRDVKIKNYDYDFKSLDFRKED